MKVHKAAEIPTILPYILASDYFALKPVLKHMQSCAKVPTFHIHQQIRFWSKHKKQGVGRSWANFTPILDINIT